MDAISGYTFNANHKKVPKLTQFFPSLALNYLLQSLLLTCCPTKYIWVSIDHCSEQFRHTFLVFNFSFRPGIIIFHFTKTRKLCTCIKHITTSLTYDQLMFALTNVLVVEPMFHRAHKVNFGLLQLPLDERVEIYCSKFAELVWAMAFLAALTKDVVTLCIEII